MKKYAKVYLSQDEWEILIHCLNDFRNKQIQGKGYCPIFIDETLCKIMKAKTKRSKAA